MKGGSEWASTAEAVAALGQSRDTIYERCRNRARRDAFPQHLIARTGGGYRIHRSLLAPSPVAVRIELTDADKDDIAMRVIQMFGQFAATFTNGRAA
jgi:hypothetical protein